jgi:ribosomal protein S8
MSVLNACLVTLTNAERRGKRQVLIRPVSKVVVKFLQVMMKHGQTTATTSRRRTHGRQPEARMEDGGAAVRLRRRQMRRIDGE